MVSQRDYYDILGVSKSASTPEIKKAYRQQALKWHPDRNQGNKEAEAKFKEINEAYEVLNDSKKRQAYDQFGHAAFSPGAGFPGGTGQTYRQGPFTYTYYSTGGSPFKDFGADFGGFSDPFEIFESFFGGSSPFRRQPPKPRYGLTIDFFEAVKGTQKTIIHQGKQYTIKVPPGADDGTRIRFADFDVTIDVQPHPKFRRDGYDIFIDHEIPFTLAALGGETQVPTVDQLLTIRIRPGTQSDTMVRLRGKGIKHLSGFARGDQYIRLIVTIPDRLSPRQKELLREFESAN